MGIPSWILAKPHRMLILAFCGTIGAVLPTSADVKNAYSAFPSLKKNVDCMTKVLKTIPNVDYVRAGVWMGDGRDFPSVTYRYSDKTHAPSDVRFIGQKSDKNGRPYIYFMTVLGGLTSPGSVPPDFGTGVVSGAWKAKCGVDAWALYE